MDYKIIDAVSSARVPTWGNGKKFIAVHYLGVDGQNHDLDADGCGAHYYVYWDGTIYQRCSHDAIVWQVGTAGYYTQKHPLARNANTIGIEMCTHCDGNKSSAEDPRWWFTKETQEATAWLVRKLMGDLNIPIENVLRHFDIVNKTCPAPYVHNNKYRGTWTWNEFLEKVKNANYQPSQPDQPTGATPYRIRKTWKDASSQLGAYYSLENAKGACPEGYSVFDNTGKEVYKRAPRVVTIDNMIATDLTGLSEADKIAKVAPIYQKVMKDTGMLASVGLAQFCLESGFGTTDLAVSANNMHGMKCSLSGNTWQGSVWDGSSKYTKRTAEQTADGREYYVTADFRKYPSIMKSVQDRAAYFIGAMNGPNKRYPNVNKIQNAEEQIKLLKAGGYATDVKYVDKLMSLVNRFTLTQYDKGITPDAWKDNPVPKDIYKVGDSFANGQVIGQIGAYSILSNAMRIASMHGKKVFDITTGKQVYPVAETPKKTETVIIGTVGPTGKAIAGCHEMDAQVKKDIANGHQWTYTNKYAMGTTFEASRSNGYYRTNCNKGVIWALIKGGTLPSSFTGNFYMDKGKLCGSAAAKELILSTHTEVSGGNKTVSTLIKNGTLQPGDILGFADMTHTSMYLGDNMWLDTGHANCKGTGEGAKFKAFVCKTPYGTSPVKTILRPIARPQYRIQCGEFTNQEYCTKMVQRMKDCGFDAKVIKYGNVYIAQAGVFSVLKNAEALMTKISQKGLPVAKVII